MGLDLLFIFLCYGLLFIGGLMVFEDFLKGNSFDILNIYNHPRLEKFLKYTCFVSYPILLALFLIYIVVGILFLPLIYFYEEVIKSKIKDREYFK